MENMFSKFCKRHGLPEDQASKEAWTKGREAALKKNGQPIKAAVIDTSRWEVITVKK